MEIIAEDFEWLFFVMIFEAAQSIQQQPARFLVSSVLLIPGDRVVGALDNGWLVDPVACTVSSILTAP